MSSSLVRAPYRPLWPLRTFPGDRRPSSAPRSGRRGRQAAGRPAFDQEWDEVADVDVGEQVVGGVDGVGDAFGGDAGISLGEALHDLVDLLGFVGGHESMVSTGRWRVNPITQIVCQ